MAKLKQEMLPQLVITTDFWVNIQKVNEMWYVWDTAENRKNLHKEDFRRSHVVLSPVLETINYN